MQDLKSPGLYIVTLTNTAPVSVNAQDPRVADKAIKVTRLNCKFGKAKNLETRRKNYFKTFGEKNVKFIPIVIMDEIEIAEKLILQKLDTYRIKGRTGRKNEWLTDISANEVENIIFDCLSKLDLQYTQVSSTYEK